jgi:hypothetical protein
MERVSKFLETLSDGAGGEAIQREVGGHRDTLKKATGYLVEDGYATRSTKGQAIITKIVKAYRQPVERSDDPFDSLTSTTSTAPQPDLNRARCQPTSTTSTTTPPYGGRGVEVEEGERGPGRRRHLNRVEDIVVNSHTGEIIATCASCGEPMAAVEPGQTTHPGCGSR